MKNILNKTWVQICVGRLIKAYVLLVWFTSKKEFINRPNTQSKNMYAVWHGRLILLPYMAEKPLHALISEHRDGRIIHYAASLFGLKTVAGSSNRGGLKAIKQMHQAAKEGSHLFITPDGPKGPNMKAKMGVLELARLTGYDITPISFSSTKAKKMRSWDNFLAPMPFGRIVIVYGDPVQVPRKLSDEEKDAVLIKIEESLTSAQNKADALCS